MMTSIWSTDEHGAWRLINPKGFPDEAKLHTMVEQAPQMLPLSGAPQLTILGREVSLGNGFADLIAVEPSGRLVVIEVKLAKNPEARRAVVAQILTYAAFLRGTDTLTLEQQILKKHLTVRSYTGLADAIDSTDQTGEFDRFTFETGLADSLARGAFRLVLVLDDAPAELIRLVGYLEAVTDGLLIDLIVVSSYEVGGAWAVVPQRIDPEIQQRDRPMVTPITSANPAKPQGEFTQGVDAFLASIDQASEVERPRLKLLADWAIALEKRGLVSLGTYRGIANRWTLLPRLPDTGVGLVTLWNEKGSSIQFWRSVFEKRAPKALLRIEALIAPVTLAQGKTTKSITPELLEALTQAYEEASAGVTLTT